MNPLQTLYHILQTTLFSRRVSQRFYSLSSLKTILSVTLIFSLFTLLSSLISCTTTTQSPLPESTKHPFAIAISKGKPSDGYKNYGNWITAIDTSVLWFDMYHIGLDSAIKMMEYCDGLLVSGGPDVFPGRYGQPEDTLGCGTIDYYRDTLEYALIEYALQNDLPILGICRGEQILNTYFGGSLYIDLPTDRPSEVKHRCKSWRDCEHPVIVEKESYLSRIAGVESGIVTTNHHQAIKDLASNLVPVAWSADSIIEAVTYKEPDGKPFLFAVQWHPERMPEGDPLSWPIGNAFLDAARGDSK